MKGSVPLVKYGYINLTGKRIYMATRKKGDESMIKKFLSILLAVCVLACFVPMDAYAIVGSVRSETEEVTNKEHTGIMMLPGSRMIIFVCILCRVRK